MKYACGTPWVLLAVAVLAGCSPTTFNKPETDNESMIIGYIDMDEASGSFTGVSMKKIQPVEKNPYYGFWIDDGMFYGGNIRPGVYKMDSFQSFSRWDNTRYTFNFPQSERTALDLKIAKPGIYYVGSWKYKKVDVGFKNWMLGRGKFDFVRIEKPTELELLKRALSHSNDTYWTNLINRRIAELGK